MMRNVPCAQLTTCKNLTVLTELESDTTKNMLARCKQRIYSKCNYKSFGMVGLFIIIRIVSVQKKKKKKTCNMPLYTALLYSKKGGGKKKLNNKIQMKTARQLKTFT